MAIPQDTRRATHRTGTGPACPVTAAEQAAIPPFPRLLAEQYGSWRRCLYAETRSKAAIEQLAGTFARLEREGASR
jgi:hypothetical protein